MPIPQFGPTGTVAEGRHQCTMDELEQAFVKDVIFAESGTRTAIFADFLSALGLLQGIGDGLVERTWIGGGFASNAVDPSDIDATFILKEATYEALSRSQKERVGKLCRKDGFKKIDLRVDGFFFVHALVALPWAGGGLVSSAVEYSSRRGAWDDWWSRQRVHGAKGDPPLLADAETNRGYLEVMIGG